MIDPTLRRKEFVSGLIEVLSIGINHQRLEDAEAVLACVRGLRPKLAELDTFDAWIAIKRGYFTDAMYHLRNVDARCSNFSLGKALMAFCQFATGDSSWTASANEVLEAGSSPDAIGLVRMLMNPDETPATGADAGASTAGDAASRDFASGGGYLRA